MDTALVKPNAQRKTFADVLTGWLSDLAAIHSLGRRELIVITEQNFALYADALWDLSPEQLHAAFLRASQVCRFFPTPADIRSQIEDTSSKVLQLEADNAWQRAMDWIESSYHPDIGVSKHAPSLEPAVRHAIVASGGFDYLFNCSREQLQWAKKRFAESYVNVHELGQVKHLLSNGAAKQILKQLSSPSQKSEQTQVRQLVPSTERSARKALKPPADPPACGPLAPDDPIRICFAALREKVNAPDSMAAPLSEQEFKDRKRRELARFNRHLQEHPELCGAPASSRGV